MARSGVSALLAPLYTIRPQSLAELVFFSAACGSAGAGLGLVDVDGVTVNGVDGFENFGFRLGSGMWTRVHT